MHIPSCDPGIDCPHDEPFNEMVRARDACARVPQRPYDRGAHKNVRNGGSPEPGVDCPLSGT